MKPFKKILILCVAFVLMATKVLAGDIVIVKKLNGVVSSDAGNVEAVVNEAVCTLTVTPADGFFISSITAEKTVSGDLAQARGDAPSMDNFLTVTPVDANADPCGTTTWTFTMPDGEYDVEVVADFQQCTSINGAVVTLSIPETGYVFDGQAKEPRVASVILDGTTISPSNYEVSYSENINAGTATVTVTGLRNYTGTASAEFTIAPKSLSDDMIWSEGEWFIYDGEAKTLADGMFGLYDEETEQSLEYDKDYSIVYANNINVGTATATVTGNGNYQGTLVHSFEIVRELNISFSETNEWATYYAEEDLELPEELRAYIVTGIGETSVSLEEINFIPKHQGVLLTPVEVAPEVIFAFANKEPSMEITDNLLKGCSENTAVSSLASDETSIYVLYNDEFVKATKGNIAAFRCYLEVSSVVEASARLAISFGDDTTGIQTQTTVSDLKQNNLYDLSGRRLQVMPAAKGLYIMNGKVVVK